MRLAVTTPTGHVSGRALMRLVAAGHDHEFVLLARHPAKLSPELRFRATVVEGALEDDAALDRLLAGADALFYVVPPHWTVNDWRAWQRHVGTIAANAVRREGVKRVVFLSSAGAQLPNAGPVTGLGEIERMFEDVAPDVVSLRPGYFMENTLSALPTITQQGMIYQNLRPDTKITMVASRDVGDAAARWLADPSWSGHCKVGVHGPADTSYSDVAATLSEVLGKPVGYAQVPDQAVAAALSGAGASPSVVQNFLELNHALATPGFVAEPRTPETTTHTTYRQFAIDTVKPALAALATVS